MSDETVDFGMDLEGNLSTVAKKFTADLKALEAQLKNLSQSHTKAERKFAKSRLFSPQETRDLQNHVNAVVRLRKAQVASAPASRFAASALRTFGVSGQTLRRFSIDAAKAETAYRRLYRVSGGGFRGASSVGLAMGRRAMPGVASGAWGIAKGATGMAATGAMVAGGAAAAGAGFLGFNMAETAIDAERVKFALDRVTNGDGARWWKTSAEYAAKFGLNVNTVADNLMNMKASGFSDDMTNTLFLRMGDLRALGATEETIGRALLAVRQVQAAGRLQGDELNQLSEAGISANFIYAELSKTLHKTIPEITQMKEAGKLTSDIVIPAIANAIGAKTGGGAAGAAGEAAASQTLTGQWGRLKGAFSVASVNALGSDQLAPARDALGSFTAWIEGPGGQRAIGAFGGVMTRMFEAAPGIVNGVIWLLETGLPAAWESFSAAFASSGGSNALSDLVGSAQSLGSDDGAAMLVWMRDAGESAGNLAGSITALVDAAMPLIGIAASISKIGMFVPNALGAVTGLLSGPGLQPTGMAPSDSYAANDNDPSILSRIGDWFTGTDSGPAGETASSGTIESVSVPTIEEASNRVVQAKETIVNTKLAPPVVHINNQIAMQETEGKTAAEVGDIVADRNERGMTSLFSQLAYSGGAG